jgi:hypothetical protein
MSSHGVFLEFEEEISGCRFYYGGGCIQDSRIFAGGPNQDSRNISIRKGNESAVTAHRRWDETNVVKQRQTKLHREKERMCREDCQYGTSQMGCTLPQRACWSWRPLSARVRDVRSWCHQVLVIPQRPKGDSQRQECRKKVDLGASRVRPKPLPPFSNHKSDDVRDPDPASRCI